MIQRMRTRVMGQLSILQLLTRKFLVRRPEGGHRFNCYAIQHDGWILKIFPRLVLVDHGVVSLNDPTDHVGRIVKGDVDSGHTAARAELKGRLSAHLARRIARAEARMKRQVPALLVGSVDWPTPVAKAGLAHLTKIHRSLVEEAGRVARETFDAYLQRNLPRLTAILDQLHTKPTGVGIAHALPQGTRFVFSNRGLNVYIIEESPRVRSVLWDHRKYQMAFPYVVHAIYLRNGCFEMMRTFFRNEPLKDSTDVLGKAPLPDLDRTGTVCMGTTPRGGTIPDLIQEALVIFWNSSFLTSHHTGYFEEVVRNIPGFNVNQWKTESAKNPEKVLSFAWPASKFTVARLGEDPTFDGRNNHAAHAAEELSVAAREIKAGLELEVKARLHEALGRNPTFAQARQAYFDELTRIAEEASAPQRLNEVITEVLTDAYDPEMLDRFLSESVEAIAGQLTSRIGDWSELLGRATFEELRKMD